MHAIEYTGASPAPWKITADSGEQWHAETELVPGWRDTGQAVPAPGLRPKLVI